MAAARAVSANGAAPQPDEACRGWFVPIEAYVLAPLDREMLRDVIDGPAKVARLRLENGLAAQLVADTASGESLPLLAFTLRQLAEGLPVGGTSTLARYEDLGGVRGALTRHADAALAEAVQVSGLAEPEVLAGLTRLVTVDETGRRATATAGITLALRTARTVEHAAADWKGAGRPENYLWDDARLTATRYHPGNDQRQHRPQSRCGCRRRARR